MTEATSYPMLLRKMVVSSLEWLQKRHITAEGAIKKSILIASIALVILTGQIEILFAATIAISSSVLAYRIVRSFFTPSTLTSKIIRVVIAASLITVSAFCYTWIIPFSTLSCYAFVMTTLTSYESLLQLFQNRKEICSFTCAMIPRLFRWIKNEGCSFLEQRILFITSFALVIISGQLLPVACATIALLVLVMGCHALGRALESKDSPSLSQKIWGIGGVALLVAAVVSRTLIPLATHLSGYAPIAGAVWLCQKLDFVGEKCKANWERICQFFHYIKEHSEQFYVIIQNTLTLFTPHNQQKTTTNPTNR